MSGKGLIVLVPAYNEEKALPETLRQLVREVGKEHVLVINDGSADSTSAVAREGGVRVIDLPANMGIGVTMQTGYQFALRNGFDRAIQCDADGQHRPEEIPALVRKMEETGADFVIGSRFVAGKGEGFQSLFLRRVAIRFFSAWIKFLSGVKIYDVTSGFRLANRRVIEIFAENYPFDYPEPEAIILLNNHGCRIEEVPVTMRERQGGVSSIGFFPAIYYMVKVTIGLALTRLREKN